MELNSFEGTVGDDREDSDDDEDDDAPDEDEEEERESASLCHGFFGETNFHGVIVRRL